MFKHTCIVAIAALFSPCLGQQHGNVSRITEVLVGGLPELGSSQPRLSGNGRFLVYQSWAQNIVYRDFNMLPDVYVHDRLLGTTDCVSRRMDGETAWGGTSTFADVSDDGRYVVFMSTADNLVANDTNGLTDIFVRDRIERRTLRVSVGHGGIQSNGESVRPRISGNGKFVTFISYADNLVVGDVNGFADAFRCDLTTGALEIASLADDESLGNSETTNADISGDGLTVAFSSRATNLVEPFSFFEHVYVRNLASGETDRVSVAASSQPANAWSGNPSISHDGKSVAFESAGSNLVPGDVNNKQDVFVRNTMLGSTAIASVATNGAPSTEHCYNPSISSDGSRVVFNTRSPGITPGDSNNDEDVFLRDISTNTTTLLSRSASGRSASGRSTTPTIDAAGGIVAFESTAQDIIPGDTNNGKDVFTFDLASELSTLGSRRALDAYGESPTISSNGRYVAFRSGADTLNPLMYYFMGGAFVHDRLTGQHELVTVSISGVPAVGGYGDAQISADGRFVVFDSGAPDLVPYDTNWVSDVFVRDLLEGTTSRVSVSSNGRQANANCHDATISANGRYVAFFSAANNLVQGINGGVFVHDRVTGLTTHESVGLQNQALYGFEPRISEDGRFLVYLANSAPFGYPSRVFVQAYVRDRTSGTVSIVSSRDGTPGNGNCVAPLVSGDGRYVAFSSSATNLAPNDKNGMVDVFRFDRVTNEIELVSVSNSGGPSSYNCFATSITSDGNLVFFSSYDPSLVKNDTNNTTDVFVRNVSAGTTKRVSLGQAGVEGNNGSNEAFGRNPLAVVFSSYASNFIPVDSNASVDVFVLDRRITPDKIDVQNGTVSGPQVSALRFSDDLRAPVAPVLLTQPVVLIMEAQSPENDVEYLEFEIESMANRDGVNQRVELYNYDTGSFDLLDDRTMSLDDQKVVLSITSGARSYVSSSGRLRTRLSFSSQGVGTTRWSAKFDHVRWSVNSL